MVAKWFSGPRNGDLGRKLSAACGPGAREIGAAVGPTLANERKELRRWIAGLVMCDETLAEGLGHEKGKCRAQSSSTRKPVLARKKDAVTFFGWGESRRSLHG